MMLEWSIAPYGSSSSAADMSSNAVSSLDVSVTGHPTVRLSLFRVRTRVVRTSWAHEVQYFSVGIAVPLA